MTRKWFTLAAALALGAVLLAGPATAQTVPGRTLSSPALNGNFYPDFAVDVQNGAADPSPGAGESNIDDYTQMNDQLNLSKDDGTIRALRTNQKNLVQDYVPAYIELKNVAPREIRAVFRTVTGKEGGRAEVVRDKVKKRNYLMVAAPAWQVPFIKNAALALDEAWVAEFNDGSADLFYRGKFRDVNSVDRIAAEWGGTQGFSRFDTTNNMVLRQDEPYRVDHYLEGAKLADVPEHQINLEGAIYELNLSNDMKLGLDYIAWKNGPGRNLFDFLLAGEKNYEKFNNSSSIFNPGTAGLLPSFLTDLFPAGRIGLDTNLDDPTHADGSRNSTGHVKYNNKSRQQYFAANFLITAAYMDFLSSKGKAKVLARPNVTTRSGTVGTWASSDPIVGFESGDLIDPAGNVVDDNITQDPGFQGTTPDRIYDNLRPVPSIENLEAVGLSIADIARVYGWLLEQDDSVSDETDDAAFPIGSYGDSNVSPRVLRYKNSGQTGLFMSILPFIGTETTELTIDFAASDLNGLTPQGTPIVNTRTLLTTVRVADGQPFVTGGIRRTEKLKMKQGAPWLSSLPVLGWFFGGTTTTDHENDVAVVLTPHIYLGAESDMALPVEAKTTIAQATGEANLPLPKNSFGFDQWLLDKDKGK